MQLVGGFYVNFEANRLLRGEETQDKATHLYLYLERGSVKTLPEPEIWHEHSKAVHLDSDSLGRLMNPQTKGCPGR